MDILYLAIPQWQWLSAKLGIVILNWFIEHLHLYKFCVMKFPFVINDFFIFFCNFFVCDLSSC